ncbi:MAG: helix-turn-helix domain-containing protein [Gemmataceae bacterium]
MQQYLTLDEAAKYLQMSPDELREMAKKKTIRAFQDRGSWRFRSQDIEELARKRGLGSEVELQLGEGKKSGDSGKKAAKPADPDLIPADFALEDDEVPIGREKPASSGPRSNAGKSGARSAKPGSDSDVRLVMDGGMSIDSDSDVRLEQPAGKGSSSGKSKKDSGSRKKPPVDDSSDSDVKLGASKEKSQSDSDIRLDEVASIDRGRGSSQGPITEEIDLDAEQAKLPPDFKTRKPSKPTQMAGKGLPTESPFELSEPDLNLDSKKPFKPAPKKTDESASDFELIPFDASKSPVELGSGEIPLLEGDEEVSLGSEVSGPGRGNSGINLKGPADSGISLEAGGSDELEFELSLDEGTTPKPQARSANRKPAEPEATDDSSSEFDLSLDDSSQTDSSSSEFELTLDDEGASADSSSEFELSLDESGSEVAEDNSDSEFELTLDDEGSLGVEEEAGDIFEETNFDVPALDDESGSEAVALDENDTDLEGSDFEISLDDDSSAGESSDSQVVAIEDGDEADDAAATVAKPRKAAAAAAAKTRAAALKDDASAEDLELDLDEKPAKSKKKQVVDDDDDDTDEDDDAVSREPAAPAEWGALPAVLLFPTVIVLFVVGIMGFELMRGMYGFHRPTVVGKPLIDNIARQFDDSLPK